MGFDKGTITNATVVTISLVAVVGLLVAGATPAAAQSDDPGFNFGDDGGEFGFGSGDDDSDSPGFDFGGGEDTGSPGFSFGGGDDTGGPGFDFGGGDDTGGPGFDFGGGEDDGGPGFDFGGGEDDGGPGFDFGDDGDGPDFDFGDGEEPDFGGGNDSDDSDQPNVTFVPTIDGTNSPVTEGETLTVDATIENTGTGDGLQTVTLTVDGQVRDSQQVSLSGGESTSVSFAWQTQDGDAGDRTASVNTATQDAQTDVTVESAGPGAPANFQVSNLQAPTEATVGDTIAVSADVENTGDQQGSQAVEFGVDTDDDGTLEVLASQDETLAGGASTTVTFDVNTSSLAAGTYTHGVSTANDTATAEITLTSPPVEQPPNFQVQNLDTNSPVTEGETLTVDATVENTGDREGTQTVTLSVLGASDDQQVTLAGGASRTVTLSVVTQTGDAGQSSAKVTTANDTVSTSVRVKAPNASADFQLSGVSSNSPVTEGDALDVTATVQNVGDQQGTQTVALSVNGTERDSQSVTLAGSASQTITLSWATQSGDAGNYTADVTSANDTGTTSVEVESAGAQPATISGTVTASGNGTAIAGAAVSAGSASTTSAADGSYTLSVSGGSSYTVTANADGYQSSSQTVSPAAGQTVTADFALPAESDGGDGMYNLTGPTDFTGYVLGDDAYLHTGTPNNSRPITYSRCRDGQPDPAEQDPGFLPTDECITFEGTVFPSNNSWVGDVNFEPVTGIINETKTDTLGNVYYEADFSTVDGARGTFDPTTGETSLETTVGINVSIWPVGNSIFDRFSPANNPYSQRTTEVTDPTCHIPNVQIVASSEKSFTSGSPFPGVGTTVSGERLNQSLYGKVVTDDFSVGSAMDCNDNYFGVNMNDQVDLEQGLPAPAGDNEAVYDIEIDLQN